MQERKKRGFFGFLRREKALQSVAGGTSGWWRTISEPFSGAWQQNVSWTRQEVTAHFAVFACTTLISSDISKMRFKLMRRGADSIMVEIPNKLYGVLNQPNHYQNRIQFLEHWVTSKLLRGNAYILKEREAGKIVALHVLNPDLVTPLVAENGDVYYQLGDDKLASLAPGGKVVPASEIIHDRFNCLFHPLVGLSPLYACGLGALQGIKIQTNSVNFFSNMSRPSGILTAPGAISDETATRLKEHWDNNFSGEKAGKTAVLGDNLKYESITINAHDSQLIEQFKMSGATVCSAYHVPKYKVQDDPPSYNNIEALEQQYYTQCLQILIESIELVLREGLELEENLYAELDIEALLRMDTKTKIESLSKAVTGGIMPPNEALRRQNLKPIEGGDTVYLQQQQYSLQALAKRDARPDPFAKADSQDKPPLLPAPKSEEPEPVQEAGFDGVAFLASLSKELKIYEAKHGS